MVFFHHTPQVKFDIGQFYKLSGVTNQAKYLPVGDNAIDMLSAVEIVEHGGMGRFLTMLTLYTLVKRTLIHHIEFDVTGFVANDDNGQLPKFRTDVGDIKLALVGLYLGRLIIQLVVQTGEETFHQTAHGLCAVWVAKHIALSKKFPVIAQTTPGIVNLGRERNIQIEILFTISQHG